MYELTTLYEVQNQMIVHLYFIKHRKMGVIINYVNNKLLLIPMIYSKFCCLLI